jgi:hypothetical protein
MSKPLVILTQKTTFICYSILLHVTAQLLKSVRYSDGNWNNDILIGTRLQMVNSIRQSTYFNMALSTVGTADGSTVVKVLCYKSGVRWFDSRWCHWNFSLT